MESIGNLSYLMESDRWASFLECSAVGMMMSLTIMHKENLFLKIQAPANCPICKRTYSNINQTDIYTAVNKTKTEPVEFKVNNIEDAVIVPLKNSLFMITRDCPYCQTVGRIPLKERAIIAQKLISGFQTAVSDGFKGGRRAVELSALRQINHLTISLLDGLTDGATRSFDLILSALIILLDAEGSWLESFNENGESNLFVKGNEVAVRSYLYEKVGYAKAVELRNGTNIISLGVLSPANQDNALSVLNLMAQESIIVFEIDRLFKLVNKQLHMVLGAIGSAVVLVGKQGNITYVNNSAEHLLGHMIIELIGKPVNNSFGPWSTIIEKRINRYVCGQMDIFYRGQDCLWLNWQVCPLLDAGILEGWIILIDDQTDHYRWQEAAHRAERLATTATMVGALSHEIRNPLSAARGLLQLINRKQRNQESLRGYVDLITREIDRVNRLLNEFLLLGKPSEIVHELLEPVVFLSELTPLLEGEAINSDVELIVDTEEVPLIMADPGQLTQVVLNIVRNAIEAVGQKGQVVLTLRKCENGVTLTVKDNGPGLSPEVILKLFQPFFTTKERGTGLGLPIVQAIVHNHGGNITAANAPDGGAVFTVSIPFHIKSDEKAANIDVMIVVMDEVIRYPCEQALRTSGFSVVSTTELGKALLWAERFCPSAIILEQFAYDTNAIELVRQAWPLTKIIVLAESDKLNINNNLNFITKPLDYIRLIGQVRRALDEVY